MLRVLLLEDDELFAVTLRDLLEEEEYEVSLCHRGEEAQDLIYENSFDLFVLDINLPDISGFEVTKYIRELGNSKPILFLTSARDKDTLIKSFNLGGDDYLTKPVDFDELLVRVSALLKRSGSSGSVELFDGFSFDLANRTLYKDSELIDLGSKTASLLYLFATNIKKAVTKEMIERELYQGQPYSEGSVRVYVNQLNTIFKQKVIKNIRGVGYKFEKE